MITIISGTNRSGSMSLKIASKMHELLTTSDVDAQVLDLRKLPQDFVFKNDVLGEADPGFSAIVDQFVRTANKFVFVIPEYNGSFPGVCKAFIDAIEPKEFRGKTAALVGLSAGRAGNLRGTDQLSLVLNYLSVTTIPKSVNILHVDQQIGDDGAFENEHSIGALSNLLNQLLKT